MNTYMYACRHAHTDTKYAPNVKGYARALTSNVAALRREEDLGLLAVLHVQDARHGAQIAAFLCCEHVSLETAVMHVCVLLHMCDCMP